MNLLDKISKSNKIAIICPYENEEKTLFDIFIITRKSSKVDIAKRYLQIEDINKFPTEIKKYPVLLNINGDQLTERIINKNEQETFLNFSESEFFKHQSEIDNEKLYIVLAKRQFSESLIKKLILNRIIIVGIGFSICSLVNYLNLLRDNDITFIYSGRNYQIKNKRLQEIKKTNIILSTKINFDGENREINEIIALTNALEYYINGISVFTKTEIIEQNYKSFKLHNFISKTAIFFLIFLFFILILNLLIDNLLDNKIKNIVSSLKQKEKILALNERQEELNKVYTYTSYTDNLKKRFPIAYMINETAYLLNGSLHIKSLEVNPIKSKIKNNELIQFNNNVIDIKGEVENSDILSDFLEQVKAVDWVKQISKVDYSWNIENKKAEIWIQLITNE